MREDFSMHKVPTFVGNRGHALDEHLIKAVWKEIESLEVKSKQIKIIVTHIRHPRFAIRHHPPAHPATYRVTQQLSLPLHQRSLPLPQRQNLDR
jgi:hypothetical protein